MTLAALAFPKRALALHVGLVCLAAGVSGCSDFEVRRTLAWIGYAPAQHLLGDMYAGGLEVDRDVVQAARWFRAAAEAGRPLSMYYLGVLIIDEQDAGIGGPEEGHRWIRAAAEAGIPAAQARLGELLTEGLGVERDVEEAMVWFRKAAQGGSATAKNTLGVIQLRQAQRSPESEAPAMRREAIKMIREAARSGLAPAQRNLGRIYLSDELGKLDVEEGVYWLRQAAALDDEIAAQLLGEMDLPGAAVDPSPSPGGRLD